MDSTDATKSVVPGKITELENFLNKKFGNFVEFSTKEIWNELAKKDQIINKGFTGNIKINKEATDTDKNIGDTDNLVDNETTHFVIKLPEKAFANDIVKTVFNFDVDFNAVEKNGKGLNDTIVQIINELKGTIKGFEGELPIEDFITDVNKAFNEYILEGQNLNATDFDFSECKKTTSDTSLNQSGTIVAKKSIVSKLKEECFGKPDKPKTPKGKTDNTGTGSGSGSGDNKGDKKGYCGSTKK